MHALARQLQSMLGTSAWFRSSPPEPAATASDIAAAELRLGRTLPPLLADLSRVSRCWSWRGAEEDVIWLPPDEFALGARRGEQSIEWVIDDADDGVDPVYDVPERLTFAFSDVRVFQIDFRPAAGGRVGQIVAFDPEEGAVTCVAPALEDFVVEGLRCLRLHVPESDGAPAGSDGVHAGSQDFDAHLSAQARTLQDLFASMASGVTQWRERMATLDEAVDDDKPFPDLDEDGDPDPDGEDLEPLSVDPALANAIGTATKGFLAALQATAPDLRKRLRAPLSAVKARNLLVEMGKTGPIPEALLPLYGTFDGQTGNAPFLPCPAGASPGLSWKRLQDVCYAHGNALGLRYLHGNVPIAPVQGLRDQFWNPRWIPLMGSPLDEPSCQATLFIDFDPPPGFPVGQLGISLLRFDGQNTTIERRRIASSLPAWLEGLTADLVAGRLVADSKGLRSQQA